MFEIWYTASIGPQQMLSSLRPLKIELHMHDMTTTPRTCIKLVYIVHYYLLIPNRFSKPKQNTLTIFLGLHSFFPARTQFRTVAQFDQRS